ncbi:MAG: Rv3235 family protein [Gemmatimonadales bacterium]
MILSSPEITPAAEAADACPICGTPRRSPAPELPYEPVPLVVDVTPFPELDEVAHRTIRLLFEAVDGRRGWSQVMPLAAPAVIRYLRAATDIYRAAGRPTRVRSVHVSQPHEGAAEIAAVVHMRRVRAVAARLQLATGGGWRCTALRIL